MRNFQVIVFGSRTIAPEKNCPLDNCPLTIAPEENCPIAIKFPPKIIAPTQAISLKDYYE